MGKHRERQNDYDFEGAEAILSEIDLDIDTFFDNLQPKKTRQHSKRSRDARRRIEEYQENRRLAERLSEYYDTPEN